MDHKQPHNPQLVVHGGVLSETLEVLAVAVDCLFSAPLVVNGEVSWQATAPPETTKEGEEWTAHNYS